MKVSQRLRIFLKTLNPDAYTKLCDEFSVIDATKQFFFTFGLLFLVMLLLFIPAILVGAPKLTAAMESFDSFSIAGNFSAAQPITLLRAPLVVVNLSENATLSKETLLFTSKDIQWKRFYLFGHASKSWDALNDAKKYSEQEYTVLLFFLVPSLAFWLAAFLLVKDVLLILVFSLLACLLPRLWRFKIGLADTLKVALFSSSIMLLIEMVLFPFIRILWLPALLFVLFLVVGIALVGDRALDDPVKKKAHPEKKEPWE